MKCVCVESRGSYFLKLLEKIKENIISFCTPPGACLYTSLIKKKTREIKSLAINAVVPLNIIIKIWRKVNELLIFFLKRVYFYLSE